MQEDRCRSGSREVQEQLQNIHRSNCRRTGAGVVQERCRSSCRKTDSGVVAGEVAGGQVHEQLQEDRGSSRRTVARAVAGGKVLNQEEQLEDQDRYSSTGSTHRDGPDTHANVGRLHGGLPSDRVGHLPPAATNVTVTPTNSGTGQLGAFF